jgi:tetratricopeptide (TPR) repeat protein
MRRLFDELTQRLKHFRAQRDNLMLLVACGDSEVAFLLKALRDLDRDSPSDLFLLFGEDFESPDSYMNSLASRLEEEVTLTNEAAGPNDQNLPPLPVELLERNRPAADRLKAGLTYAHSLVDPSKGQKYIWGMGPMTIADEPSYLELLAQLPPSPQVEPWMRGGRIVARVPADFALENSPLAGAMRVTEMKFVIPPNAQEDELAAMASDPKVSQGDRMQAEVQLAYLDCAHGRFDAARERFRRALAFFQWMKLPELEGLIICGLGDIARRQNDLKQAQHWYECAVVPIAESGSPMLLATVVRNLAAVAYEEQRWADAEQRYSELAEINRSMFDEVSIADALEWQGLSQEKQDALDRAVLSWEEAALICKSFDMHDRLVPLLTHLRRGYLQLRMYEELETFDADWKA